MEWLELTCRLDKCEIDSSQEMDPSKCCATGGKFSPCLHVSIRKKNELKSGDVWGKLNDIIQRDKKQGAKEKGKDHLV